MYRPQAVFLIGVATQIKGNVDLGDALMVHAVNRYEPAGSMESEVQRQQQELVMEEQLQWSMFSYDARSTSYNRRLAVFMSELGGHPRPRDLPKSYSPRVITRDVVAVSGNRVFEDLQFVIEHLHKGSDDRVSIADEESYGFAAACDGRVWWGIVRGISSIGRPEGKGNAWHYVASGSAAVCLKDFLVEEFLPSGEGEL
jgi:hypothetical protein